MNRNKFYSILYTMAIAGTTLSCNKFLDAPPSKTTSLVVSNTAQLSGLLNNYTTFALERNYTAAFSSDDADLPVGVYNALPQIFPLMVPLFTVWDTENQWDYNLIFWRGEYNKIFQANMALSYVDKITGPQQEKDVIRADAHLIRAYSYFELVNTFCLPYTPANAGEPGLPLKLTTSFEEPVDRQSLEKTYEQIEADLHEALKITVPLVQDGVARNWRASTAGVNGFAARFYLNRNRYEDAISYADKVLAEYNRLVDYNTEMRYGTPISGVINYDTPNPQQVTINFPYLHDNPNSVVDVLGWKEFLYLRVLGNDLWWFMPSQALLGLYDKEHDLRYKYHMVDGFSYVKGMIQPALNYPGYAFFFEDRMPSGPTVAEMLLIKAECQARLGNIADAMNTVNILRAKRFTPGAWVNLTATDKNDAIKKILQERRREMPFCQRWFDMKRLNNNEDPNDDVVVSRTFYPYNSSKVLDDQAPINYVLPKNSRKYAAPIPQSEIISSNGKIQQNTY